MTNAPSTDVDPRRVHLDAGDWIELAGRIVREAIVATVIASREDGPDRPEPTHQELTP